MNTPKLIIGLWLSHFALASFSYGAESADVNVTRLAGGPIITPDMDDRMGGNTARCQRAGRAGGGKERVFQFKCTRCVNSPRARDLIGIGHAYISAAVVRKIQIILP